MFLQLKIYLLSFLLRLILNAVFLTCKVQSNNSSLFFSYINKRPILLSVWHHNSLLLAKYINVKKIPVWTVSSTHPDSEILAKILLSWKIKLIRGSSTRGWINIIKQMVGLYKKTKAIIVITPDGPRGPRKQAKTGAFNVANKYGAAMFAVSAVSSRFWSLPSWDKTIIPKPFSTIYVDFIPLSTKKLNSQSISKQMNQNQIKLNNVISNN